jgi:hypothetical protein
MNKIVIERSFNNLDPYKFYYTYPGPLIQVNHDESITIDRGTMAIFVPVTVEYASVLNLIVTPTSNAQLAITPQVHIPLGMNLTHLNISVP